MKQNSKKKIRNYSVRVKVKSLMKEELKYIKENKVEDAKKHLQEVFSAIDTACKKNILHKNNAARKKSRLATALNALEKGGKEVKVA